MDRSFRDSIEEPRPPGISTIEAIGSAMNTGNPGNGSTKPCSWDPDEEPNPLGRNLKKNTSGQAKPMQIDGASAAVSGLAVPLAEVMPCS